MRPKIQNRTGLPALDPRAVHTFSGRLRSWCNGEPSDAFPVVVRGVSFSLPFAAEGTTLLPFQGLSTPAGA
jgi:hypothetical protein